MVLKYIRDGAGGNYGGRQIFLDQTGRGRQILLKEQGGTEYFWTKRGSRPRKLARTRGRIPQPGLQAGLVEMKSFN